MKILHVARQFYPCQGGIPRFTYDLCKHLQANGYEVAVVTLDVNNATREKMPAYDYIDGIDIHRIKSLTTTYYDIAPSVIRYFENYDIIHVHAIDFFIDYIMATRFIHKKPVVVSTHGGFFHTKDIMAFKRLYFKTISRFALSRADRVISISKPDYEIFSEILDDNLVRIDNGVEYERFAQISNHYTKGNLIYWGRLYRSKRLDLAIDALPFVREELPNVHLTLIGTDFEGTLNSINKRIKDLGLEKNVTYAGSLSDKELQQHVSEAQYFLSPSEYEGFGITVIEAMASRTIPILNDIDTFREFIDHGQNGFITDFTDPQVAARQILDAIGVSKRKYEEMGKVARKKASEYAWSNVVKKFERVYKSVLNKKEG